ncbi:MAG: hypothetical protein NVS9B12_06090 [Vulcanimicrobiaceae bacterium]
MTGGEKLGSSAMASRGIAKTPSKRMADAIIATATRRVTANRAIGLMRSWIGGALGKDGGSPWLGFRDCTHRLRAHPEKGLCVSSLRLP